MSDESADLGATAFMRVLRGLLRPLVRLMIARGVTLPAFTRMMKALYVETAEADFRLDGQKMTDSRISVLTGVHRRDVRALRDPVPDPARQSTTLLATVVGRWMADPLWQDGQGAPAPLPRQSSGGPSFESLVRAVNKDVRPRTVLDELLRQGLVGPDADGRLRLDRSALVGPGDRDHKSIFFAANIGDHIAAAAANLDKDPAPFFERALFYNRLRPDSVAAVETRARALSTEALVALNTLAARHQSADAEDKDATHRLRFGLYFYHEDEAGMPDAGDEGTSA